MVVFAPVIFTLPRLLSTNYTYLLLGGLYYTVYWSIGLGMANPCYTLHYLEKIGGFGRGERGWMGDGTGGDGLWTQGREPQQNTSSRLSFSPAAPSPISFFLSFLSLSLSLSLLLGGVRNLNPEKAGKRKAKLVGLLCPYVTFKKQI